MGFYRNQQVSLKDVKTGNFFTEPARCLTSFLGRFDKEIGKASWSELRQRVVGGFNLKQPMETQYDT